MVVAREAIAPKLTSRCKMLQSVLFQCVSTSVPYLDNISLDDRFVDLDFDSLRFIQLVVQLENVLGIEFEDEKLNPALFERVGDLLAYLEILAAEAPTESMQ